LIKLLKMRDLYRESAVGKRETVRGFRPPPDLPGGGGENTASLLNFISSHFNLLLLFCINFIQ
jgi:hypothetical protein